MIKKFASFLFVTILLLWTSGAWAQPGRVPSIAYDTGNNRYLMVWEEDSGNGQTQIMGKFLNPDGSNVGNQTTRLSPDRPNHGCFYQNFDSENGAITTPTNCPTNSNPTVAYNNGRYLIAWEVHGTAASPSTSPENNFINIFARIVDASTLNPIPSWEEGILISKAYISANDFQDCGNGKYACSDSEIQAWGQAENPHVAPRIGTDGFVVTWQTNKDFIGCVDKIRRGGRAVYGRYIDQNFSATSTTNPAIFPVFKDDSTITDKCEDLANVDNATNPRIAYNQTTNDFVIAYEWGRANNSNASIGAKRVTLDGANVGQVDGAMMPGLVAASQGQDFSTPSIVSFKNEYVLFAAVSNQIGVKKFSSNDIQSSELTILNLGNGTLANPFGASNLGTGGVRPNGSPAALERLILGYRNGGNVFAITLDGSLNLTKGPVNISNGIATQNDILKFASNLDDFVGVWQGSVSNVIQVFSTFVDSEDGPVATPQPPQTPTVDTDPAHGATWTPTRLNLNWQASVDPNPGDSVSYNVYFIIGNEVPAGTKPYRSGITDTHFVIQASTDARAQYDPDPGIPPMYLTANTDYAWKICAADTQGHETCSPVRQFHTDNSVVGWWRFDEDPAGSVCLGGQAGEMVCDYSGNNNHGIPFGVTWIAPGMPDILGGAFDFDGLNDYAQVPPHPSFNVGSSLSFSCKLNPDADGNGILSGEPTGRYGLEILNLNTAFCDFFVSGTWEFVSADITQLLGNFFRTTCIYDGAKMDIFIDQTLEETKPLSGPILNNNHNIILGNNPFTNVFYDGSIDECILYNRSLISEEAVNLAGSDL